MTVKADLKVVPYRGTTLHTKGWIQEAALRMLNNNLNPEVAENPDQLVVYGGIGKAARNWESYEAIVRELKDLENDETLLIQSGKPVAVFKTHTDAPKVLIANRLEEHTSELQSRFELVCRLLLAKKKTKIITYWRIM